jgi:hypothetical protein
MLRPNLSTSFIINDRERFQFIYAGYYHDRIGKQNVKGLHAVYAALQIENEEITAIEFVLMNYGPKDTQIGFKEKGGKELSSKVLEDLRPTQIGEEEYHNNGIKYNQHGDHIKGNHIVIPTYINSPINYTVFRPDQPIPVSNVKDLAMIVRQGPFSKVLDQAEKFLEDNTPERLGLAGRICIESGVVMI